MWLHILFTLNEKIPNLMATWCPGVGYLRVVLMNSCQFELEASLLGLTCDNRSMSEDSAGWVSVQHAGCAYGPKDGWHPQHSPGARGSCSL